MDNVTEVYWACRIAYWVSGWVAKHTEVRPTRSTLGLTGMDRKILLVIIRVLLYEYLL